MDNDLALEAWFEDGPRCANDGDAPARPCARCGRFCCALCADVHEPDLCAGCAVTASRARLPQLARGVAWKLALAPTFALVSAGVLAARHQLPPPSLALWAVPITCALILLMRPVRAAAWLGTVASLGLLGWQAFGTASSAEWDRLIDVAVLSIAPVAAVFGSLRLSRMLAQVRLAEAASATIAA